jgi:hypothetical protein
MTISRSTQDCFNDSNTGQVISNPPGKLVSGGARSPHAPRPTAPPRRARIRFLRARRSRRETSSDQCIHDGRIKNAACRCNSSVIFGGSHHSAESALVSQIRGAQCELGAVGSAECTGVRCDSCWRARAWTKMRARSCSRDWNDGGYVINHRLPIEVLVADPKRAVR